MDLMEQLICSVESSADWREAKAAQFPNDTRNWRSAQSLRKLAEKLEELPANDPHLGAYEEINGRAAALGMSDAIAYIEGRLIGRYGFDYDRNGDPAEFFRDLAVATSGVVEGAEERESDPSPGSPTSTVIA